MAVMTRERLRRLLEPVEGEAADLFRSLLDDPAARIEVPEDGVPVATSSLQTIYRRRAEHVRKVGLPVLDFDEAVRKLQTTEHDKLRLALGTGRGGQPACVAFLAQDSSAVVAVLAVLAPDDEGVEPV